MLQDVKFRKDVKTVLAAAEVPNYLKLSGTLDDLGVDLLFGTVN